MLYRISVAEHGLTGIANIFRSRLSRLDDLLRAGTVPLKEITHLRHFFENIVNNFPNTVFHSLFRNTYYFPN